jgi:hypothetical protein
VFDKEEHVERFQSERFHCEEITGQELLFVVSQECGILFWLELVEEGSAAGRTAIDRSRFIRTILSKLRVPRAYAARRYLSLDTVINYGRHVVYEKRHSHK